MAERFTGVVIVRCNCDHAVSGAPITVTVNGASGVECTSTGITQQGYFLISYERGARPVDIQSMQGTVLACGVQQDFQSSTIRMSVDWAAVAQRINAARNLPRGTSVDDLKEQAEFFGSFTSLDLVMFSCIIEVTVQCHPECTEDTPDEHGVIGPTDSVGEPPSIGIALDCPTELAEYLNGVSWGWGSNPDDGAAAVQEAKDRAAAIARAKAAQRAAPYFCRPGCEPDFEFTYDPVVASKPFRFNNQGEWQCMAVVGWHVVLKCKPAE